MQNIVERGLMGGVKWVSLNEIGNEKWGQICLQFFSSCSQWRPCPPNSKSYLLMYRCLLQIDISCKHLLPKISIAQLLNISSNDKPVLLTQKVTYHWSRITLKYWPESWMRLHSRLKTICFIHFVKVSEWLETFQWPFVAFAVYSW